GEPATPAEYARRFGVDVSAWPTPDEVGLDADPTWSPMCSEERERLFRLMPRVGSEFHGFHMIAELGQGSFGRVYLCRQGDLADRLVVLKIIAHQFGETRTLARLQHNHIVPIYSVHRTDDLDAICMPFLGATTLADILRDLRGRDALPNSGKYLLERVEARA